MKMNKKSWFYLLLFFGNISILFTACVPENLEPIPVVREPTPIPTLSKMEMEIVEPRPDFIRALRPPEYYVVPLSLYNLNPEGLIMHRILEYDPSNLESYKYGYQSSICVNPLMKLLVQEGDFLSLAGNPTGEYTEERLELVVDGTFVDSEIQGTFGILAGKSTRVPEGPRTSYVENVDYCWKVPLNVGQHEATFRFFQTSGDIQSYTWYFEISDD